MRFIWILIPCIIAISSLKSSSLPRPITQMIEDRMEKDQIPMLGIVMVELKNQPQFFCYSSSLAKSKLTKHRPFPLRDIGLSFSVCLMQELKNRGDILLDKPLYHILPEFSLKDSYLTFEMNMLDLAIQRAGFSKSVDQPLTSSFQERLNRLCYLDINQFRKETKERIFYLGLLQKALEKIGKSTYEKQLETLFFKPLMMKTTSLLTHTIQGHIGQKKVKEHPELYVEFYTSLEDFAKFMHWQLLYADLNLYHPKSKFQREDKRYLGYGIGYRLFEQEGRIIAEQEAKRDGFSLIYLIDPEREKSCLIMANQENSHFVKELIYPLFLHQPFQKTAIKKYQVETFSQKKGTKPHLLKNYIGVYEHPFFGKSDIIEKNGQLFLRYSNNHIYSLNHFHHQTFQLTQDRKSRPVEHSNLPFQFLTFYLRSDGQINSFKAVKTEQKAKEYYPELNHQHFQKEF